MPALSLDQALRHAAAELSAAGVPSPRVDAEILAAHLLGESVGRVRALAFTDAAAPEGYDELVAERARRIPLQHLTGKAYFRRLELAVGPGVFVPRPETETVAQLAIDRALLQSLGLETRGVTIEMDPKPLYETALASLQAERDRYAKMVDKLLEAGT